MFKRKIEEELKRWKESLTEKRKAFVLKGLRQVGKTKSIRDFAEKTYENVVYINFKTEKNLKEAFDGNLSVNVLISNISAMKPEVKFVPYKTVIIFDEVQECSGARASIKSFVEDDDRFDVIASGSLLGLNGYNKKYNGGVSVGYEHVVYLKPMDFEEFLWAKGINEDVIEYIKDCFKTKTKVREAINSSMNRYLREYLCVGGMPSVVDTFVRTNDFNQVREEQLDILEGYKADFGKHLDENEQEKTDLALLAKINNVFNAIPAQLSKENKKFMYSHIAKKATSTQYDPAIRWLCDYGLINYCYNLRLLERPLSGNKIPECFKIYVADSGLFVAMLEKEAVGDILLGDLGIYKGAIYENIIADAFSKMGRDLFYFSKDSGLEIDFITRYEGKINLIEVKAKNGNAKSSKFVLQDKEKYKEVSGLIKLDEQNIGYVVDELGNTKFTVPHYLAFCLKE